jgi:glucose/arabinose dehydrogenase
MTWRLCGLLPVLAAVGGCNGNSPSEPSVPADGGAIDAAAADGPAPVAADTCRGPAAAQLANARLPAGFCAWAWAAGLAKPRGLATVANGDLLVVESGRSQVVALYDDDGDGVSGMTERAVLATASGLNHGVAVSGGYLYASSPTTLYRWPYQPGMRAALGTPEVVVSQIPSGGHSTRTPAFDAQGRLYLSIGSGSNLDGDSSRARIRRFSLATIPPGGIPFSTGEVFADGLRNEVGLGFDGQGRLWGVENGSDNLGRGDLGGDIHNDNPAEEMNLFAEAGHFYGYPFCWSERTLAMGRGPGTQWAYGNDATHTDQWCQDPANNVPPRFALPAHVAPLDILFYDGASFPADWKGDAIVTFHGSWNRDMEAGYKVVRVVFSNGDPVRIEPLLAYQGPGDRSGNWPHRPVSVRQGRSGELYVSSDSGGVIVAIGHSP